MSSVPNGLSEHMADRYVEYKNRELRIRIGSIVTPKETMYFYGLYHWKGDRYTVTNETISYFIVNLNEYIVVKY